jgi:hypothetical protein
MMLAMVEPEQQPKMTLGEFIKNNHHLLAALGVFAALTALANQLTIKALGQFLSFFCLAATILLGIELYAQVPPGTARKLDFFKTAVYFILLLITAYWLIEYRAFWKIGLSGFIALLLAVFVGKRRRELYRKLGWHPEAWRPWKRALEGIVLGLVTLWLLFVGMVLYVPANGFLDALKIILNSITPK